MHTGRRFAVLATALGLVLSLAACGGDGKGSSATSRPIPSSANVRSLTGSQLPAESVADQRARAAGILARSDSHLMSAYVGETSNPDLPTFRFRANCSGTRCVLREPTIGLSTSFDLSDLEFRPGDSRAVLTKNGITMVEGRAATGDAESYGAWMNHAVFSVTSGRWRTDQGVDGAARFGRAVGDLTGVRPDITASWRGLMVGTPSGGALRGNVLQGDAALSYTVNGTGGAIDAAFTDIKDIDRGAAHSTTSVRFDDVHVAVDGTYRAGLTGNRIQGGFYGSGHAEAAGVFEQSGIVGAFGARR